MGRCIPTRLIARRRRGVASLLAMLFLILFSALAIGFYSTATMSAQVSRNERTASEAMLATEGGLQFMRYQLGCVDIPTSTSNDNLLTAVCSQLGLLMNGTTNMGGQTVQVSNSAISIPSATGWVNLDAAGKSRFRAVVTSSGSFLILTLVGQGSDANIQRTIQVKFQKAPLASAIFNFGVAAKGPVTMSGSVKIEGATDPTKGSLLSATAGSIPLTMSGAGSISGDFSYTNPLGVPSYGTGSIAGFKSSNPNFAAHVHAGVTPPQFPSIDTSAYLPYATNTWTTSTGKTIVNCVIPPNSNPSFSGNTTVQGVLYIKTPNRVTFSGNCTIQGCIVVENNPTGTSNQLTFSGSVSASSISTLPNNATFPAGERALTGAFLLAPKFAVTFSGNFGTIGGSMVADQFTFSGNAGGTVQGSVIALADVPMTFSGNSDIVIASTGTTNYPTGVTFGSKFAALPDTYVELPME